MLEIYLVDHEKEQLFRVGYTDNIPGLLGILQMMIDGITDFDNRVVVKNTETGHLLNLDRIQKETGLRKRTFQEKLDDVKTWKL